MIDIKNVSFGYSEGECNNLKNINLHIDQGECVLLCGKSRCGKTTVTKLVNGLIPHFIQGHLEGKVISAGMDVTNTKMYQLSSKIGSVFQNPKSQFFNIDSDSELTFGLENEGMKPELIRKRVSDTICEVKIEKLTGRNIFTMSGGEKQTLAFASVYAMNPDVYVLDEPSANLDQKAIQTLKKQIEKIKELGKTILIAEHRLYYLTDLIDKAVYMENGESVWDECKISARQTDDNTILNILQEFNLDIYKEKHPMVLSGGQKQRLAISTGVLADKKILIFDEPTSGLDYENMCVVSKMIKKLSKENHIIFIVTHDMEFLDITCDRTIDRSI